MLKQLYETLPRRHAYRRAAWVYRMAQGTVGLSRNLPHTQWSQVDSKDEACLCCTEPQTLGHLPKCPSLKQGCKADVNVIVLEILG